MKLDIRGRAIVASAAAIAGIVPLVLVRPAQQQIEAPLPIIMPLVPRASPLLTGDALSRPLFASDRMPHAANEQAPPSTDAASVQSGPPLLAGVVIGRGRSVVLLKLGSGETVTAHIGEEADGWRVVSIARGSVVLDQGGHREEVRLNFDAAIPSGGSSAQTRSSAPATVGAHNTGVS